MTNENPPKNLLLRNLKCLMGRQKQNFVITKTSLLALYLLAATVSHSKVYILILLTMLGT